MRKLRKRYPDCVPVICMCSNNSSQQMKLLMRSQTTGAGFVATARERCKWATEASEVLLWTCSRTMKVPKLATLKDLDALYKAPDDALYFKVEAAIETQLEHDPREPQHFKMDGAVPKELRALATASSKDDPAEKARRIRKIHPDRVPVLINQAATPGLPALEKKLLIPISMTCGNLRKILPKHIHLDKVDWSQVIFHMAGDDVAEHELVSDIYARRVEPDDEGMLLSLELNSEYVQELSSNASAGEAPTEHAQEVPGFSPPSAEEVKVLEGQLTEINVAFREAQDAGKIAAAKLAEEEERTWTAEEKALKSDLELLLQSQAYRSQEEDLQSQIMEAKKGQDSLETEVVSSEEQIQAMRLQIARVQESLENLQSKAQKDSERMEEIRQSLQEARGSLVVEAKKYDSAQETISQFEVKLQQAAEKDMQDTKTIQLESHRETLAKDRIFALQNSLHQISEKLENVDEEKEGIMKQQKPNEVVRKLKGTVSILRDALQSKQADITSKRREAVETMLRLRTLEAENRRLQGELTMAIRENLRLQQDHDTVTSEVENLKAQLKEDEEFVKVYWNSIGEVEAVVDFGFQKVDTVCE